MVIAGNNRWRSDLATADGGLDFVIAGTKSLHLVIVGNRRWGSELGNSRIKSLHLVIAGNS